jgi:signal transduction histidine kinase
VNAPELSKHTLGMGYVVGTGVTLSLALLAHAVTALQSGPSAVVVLMLGFLPALALVGANYWLPRSGLQGDQIWTVAEWSGLGIGLLTLLNLGVVSADVTVATVRTGLLASTVTIGGFVGILVGTLLELRRDRQRLAQSNDVLNRILRHDMRNRLNVMLGHISALERTASGESSAHTEELRETVEELIRTSEKARQIDVALGANRRAQRPVDLVPAIETRLDAVRRANPDATVEAELPEQALVQADWLVGSVLDNVIENTVVHSEAPPTLSVSVVVDGGTTTVELVDDCPTIPAAERDVFEARTETQLQHSKGVGLWLVIWVVESYGGSVEFGTTADGGNVVTLTFQTATWLSKRRVERP